MELSELRKTEKTKLIDTLNKKRKELLDKKLMSKVGKEKNMSLFKYLRKDIAQINTVLKEKEIINE
jgi:ribosomal protein L29